MLEIKRENFPTKPIVVDIMPGRLRETLKELFPPGAIIMEEKIYFNPLTLKIQDTNREECIDLRVGEKDGQPALLWIEKGLYGEIVGRLTGGPKGIYLSSIKECYIRQDRTGKKWLDVVSDTKFHYIRERRMFGLKEEQTT